MKIAMLTNNYKPFVGGVPVSVERLALGLRELGHQVTIFAPSYTGQEPEAGVIRCRALKHQLPGGIVIPDIFDPTIERAFREERFDLIHTHHPMLMGQTALRLGRKHDLPVVLTYHTRYSQYLHYLKPWALLQKDAESRRGTSLGRAEAALMSKIQTGLMPACGRAFARGCDMVLAPSPAIREQLLREGVSCPIRVLTTGLSPRELAPMPETSASLRRALAGGRSRVFCTVSRLEPEKDLPFMLRGLAAYKQQAGDDFRMVFIGGGTQKTALAAQAQALGLGDQVVFAGTVPHSELPAYYGAADLFLFSSKSETQGIVLLEAMAAGLPVVAVEGSGICDVVENGRNGFCTPNDEELWAAAVCRALGQAHRVLSAGARATAQDYSQEQIAKRAEGLYLDAIALHRQNALSLIPRHAHEGLSLRQQKVLYLGHD